MLVQHPRVDMVSFTGSTETGQSLARKAAMIPLQLELGGKDAAIVLSDADLEATASDIVSGAFAYSGQRCTAVKRVLAVDASSAQGAVRMTEAAVAKGARLVLGGTREGNLVAPTLIDHVTPDMDIAWVEPFAPVLPIIRVRNAEEAVRLANRSEYGLQAAIFSRDVDVAMHVGLALDVGTVQINGTTALVFNMRPLDLETVR
ncbi:aldehyde dehydrogenase family protein [Pseudonocardia bannensis]